MKRAVIVLAALLSGPALAAEEPADYRNDDYRAPVPDTLKGATVLDDDAAYAVWKTDKALFVDVLPKPPKPQNLPKGTIWREPRRNGIPGAIWLPNIGYGRIHETVSAYFRDNLAARTDGKDHPVVFYCLMDCWMSWNAARRAMQDYGYTHVFWYPAGTDGWEFADYPLEPVKPVE